MNPEDLIAEQVDDDRARAPEYDTWWFRDGTYDPGPQLEGRRGVLGWSATVAKTPTFFLYGSATLQG